MDQKSSDNSGSGTLFLLIGIRYGNASTGQWYQFEGTVLPS
jgi:hypothetical protein